MGDAVTLRLRGEGGGVWDMDVPAAGTHARERFETRLGNGQLIVLTGADDEEEMAPAAALAMVQELGDVAPVDTRKVRSDGAPPPPPAAVGAVEPPKVGAGSGRDAWAVYAASKGIDTEGMNRAEIIAAVETPAT